MDHLSLSPIPKVLSTIRDNGVEALLMGGQACVLYGAAEFSRDADFAIVASPGNLERLSAALAELRATVIAVPPFEARYLERGHAIHFRCQHPEERNFRVAVMSRLRGVDSFADLWSRRTTWNIPGGVLIESLSLEDLVASKKTQRDKDWPMVRRLVEVSYDQGVSAPTSDQIEFWLRELRTPELLLECAGWFQNSASRIAPARAAVGAAIQYNLDAVRECLAEEQDRERALDREYWAPLKAELEALRHSRRPS